MTDTNYHVTNFNICYLHSSVRIGSPVTHWGLNNNKQQQQQSHATLQSIIQWVSSLILNTTSSCTNSNILLILSLAFMRLTVTTTTTTTTSVTLNSEKSMLHNIITQLQQRSVVKLTLSDLFLDVFLLNHSSTVHLSHCHHHHHYHHPSSFPSSHWFYSLTIQQHLHQ